MPPQTHRFAIVTKLADAAKSVGDLLPCEGGRCKRLLRGGLAREDLSDLLIQGRHIGRVTRNAQIGGCLRCREARSQHVQIVRGSILPHDLGPPVLFFELAQTVRIEAGGTIGDIAVRPFGRGHPGDIIPCGLGQRRRQRYARDPSSKGKERHLAESWQGLPSLRLRVPDFPASGKDEKTDISNDFRGLGISSNPADIGPVDGHCRLPGRETGPDIVRIEWRPILSDNRKVFLQSTLPSWICDLWRHRLWIEEEMARMLRMRGISCGVAEEVPEPLPTFSGSFQRAGDRCSITNGTPLKERTDFLVFRPASRGRKFPAVSAFEPLP